MMSHATTGSEPALASRSPQMANQEYLLGTGTDEVTRLALQHRLWSDASVQAWRRAKLSVGQRVLDVGCGPCSAAMDMAEIVTQSGYVLGIDESQSFIDHANGLAAAHGTSQLEAQVGDVQDLESAVEGKESFDFAYARWVLCFVRDPDAVVRGIANALAKGGRLLVQDYFNFGAMTLAPRRPSHDIAVKATMQSWLELGGDPDIGARLPAMFHKHGLRLDDVRAHARVARGSDPMFAWPNTWWRTFAPKLVATGHLKQSDCNALIDDMQRIENGEGFIQCPLVYEFLATKI